MSDDLPTLLLPMKHTWKKRQQQQRHKWATSFFPRRVRTSPPHSPTPSLLKCFITPGKYKWVMGGAGLDSSVSWTLRSDGWWMEADGALSAAAALKLGLGTWREWRAPGCASAVTCSSYWTDFQSEKKEFDAGSFKEDLNRQFITVLAPKCLRSANIFAAQRPWSPMMIYPTTRGSHSTGTTRTDAFYSYYTVSMVPTRKVWYYWPHNIVSRYNIGKYREKNIYKKYDFLKFLPNLAVMP